MTKKAAKQKSQLLFFQTIVAIQIQFYRLKYFFLKEKKKKEL